jgi:hypothetical protein
MKQPANTTLYVRMTWGAVALAVYAGAVALVHYLAPENWVVISGVSSLGLLTGVLVAFFVQEAEEWNHRALGYSVATLASSGVLALLRLAEIYVAPNDDTQVIWFYPIGLVVGFVIGTVWDWRTTQASDAHDDRYPDMARYASGRPHPFCAGRVRAQAARPPRRSSTSSRPSPTSSGTRRRRAPGSASRQTA